MRIITWLILVALVLGALLGHWLNGFKGDDVVAAALEQRAAGQPLEVAPDAPRSGELNAIAALSPDEARIRLDAMKQRRQTYETARGGLWFVGNDIFIRLLKMLIIPLIISSVIVGVASVGDFRNLGRIGGKTFVYYFATMLIAVTIGLLLVSSIRPGRFMQDEQTLRQAERDYQQDTKVQAKIEDAPEGFGQAILNILRSIIPANPVEAAATGKVLPIIFFCIFFAIILTTVGPAGELVVRFFDVIFQVMMKMVHIVIWLAPLGVFCLLAWTVAAKGLGVFVTAISIYMLTVMGGLAIHGLIVLPLLLWLFGRTRPYVFMRQMRQALMTAFGTDSSSATLPVTIECATEQGGCSKKAAGFVLPLGATINMDGTALFESVAVVFIAQAYGFELGFLECVVVALTATLTAVGAAGIPSASLVLMPTVIIAVNQTLGAGDGENSGILIAGIGLILGVDRILDMCRTTVNVWGDAVGAKIISRLEPDAAAAPAVAPGT